MGISENRGQMIVNGNIKLADFWSIVQVKALLFLTMISKDHLS